MERYRVSIIFNRRNFVTGSAAVSAFSALPAYAKKSKRGVSSVSKWSAVQAQLDETVRKKYVPGAGAVLARGTDQADFLVAGTLAKGSTVAITPDSLWRVYSMTKPVTGIAAMLLVEDGKLTLDQNIADFIPGFANPKVLTDPDNSLDSRPSRAPITVRTLLTHTAGLGYAIITKGLLLQEYLKLGLTPGSVSRKTLPGFEPVAPTAPSLEEFANRLATLPLIADPGAKWSYSVSLDLLGRVIELASGMSFEAFVQKRIFDPLGMTSTFWQVPAKEVARMTTNYAGTPFGAISVDPGDDSVFFDKPAFPFGGAGLVSSMRDFDRFLAMLAGQGALGKTRIMKADTARLAMSNLVHPETKMEGLVKGQGFGAGGRVTIKDDPLGAGVGTFGWAGAASTIAWVDPTRGIRASGWAQIMTRGDQPFTEAFRTAVYASLKGA
jgi:CubicO group peptidase (beta-lactamase class C family)